MHEKLPRYPRALGNYLVLETGRLGQIPRKFPVFRVCTLFAPKTASLAFTSTTKSTRKNACPKLRASVACERLPLAVRHGPRLHGADRQTQRPAMIELLQFISYLIDLYTYVIIASVIMSWLMAFGVINAYNPMVRSIWQGLNAVTEPLLGPIRRALPSMGGIDISPLILLLACFFVQSVILPNIAKVFR
jgi:YggT family protein